jgi:hypothetical protein
MKKIMSRHPTRGEVPINCAYSSWYRILLRRMRRGGPRVTESRSGTCRDNNQDKDQKKDFAIHRSGQEQARMSLAHHCG